MTDHKMTLMKPHPDACQVCAREHEPHLPHDQQSLYYQMAFHAQNGRYPTWADAMAHCAPEVKRRWPKRTGSNHIFDEFLTIGKRR